MASDPFATRVLEEYAEAAAQRSGLAEPQRTEGKLELLSHLFDLAQAKATERNEERVLVDHARLAVASLGDSAAVDQAFFAPRRAQGERAPLLRRGFAYVLDTLLFGFAAVFATEMMGWMVMPFLRGFEPLPQFLLVAAAIVAFEATTGQTPGKMVLRMRAVRVTGAPLDWEKALLRNLTKAFPPLVFVDALLGWLAFRGQSERLSDRYAGTIVVREAQR